MEHVTEDAAQSLVSKGSLSLSRAKAIGAIRHASYLVNGTVRVCVLVGGGRRRCVYSHAGKVGQTQELYTASVRGGVFITRTKIYSRESI